MPPPRDATHCLSTTGVHAGLPSWLLREEPSVDRGTTCPRCEGLLYRDEYGDWGCYTCGWQGYRHYQGPEITGRGLRLPGS